MDIETLKTKSKEIIAYARGKSSHMHGDSVYITKMETNGWKFG